MQTQKTPPEQRLLLVDASSYLYRAFHALPDLRSPGGEPTGAIRGVVMMLANLVKQYPAQYIACVFDPKGKTFRDDLFPEYKATRSAMPEDLRKQVEPLFDTIRALGWPLIVVDGVEADDVIGTLARYAAEHDMETVISTGDKDLTQLVSDKVRWVNTMSNEELTPAGVKEKFGVPPERIVDYLALVGDTVDNVPGVEKCGPKTAVKWLGEYDSLDGVMANADKIKGVVGENLRKALDWLPTARVLVTVKTDCELPLGVKDLTRKDIDQETLGALYERFGFRSMREGLAGNAQGASLQRSASPPPQSGLFEKESAKHAGASPSPSRGEGRGGGDAAAPLGEGATPTLTLPPQGGGNVGVADDPPAHASYIATRNYVTITTDHQLSEWLAKINAADLTCFDTETTSLDPLQAQLVGLSFCVEAGHACYIPVAHHYAGAPDQLNREHVLAKLKVWFESDKHKKLAQNAKYDCHVLANHGITVRGVVHDTLLQNYVLESHMRHDMDSLAMRYLNMRPIAFEDVAGKGANQIGFDQVSVEKATEYSAEDADVTLQLHHAQYPKVASDGKLRYVYESLEMPISEILFTVERNGVLLDTKALEQQSHELGMKAMELERKAHELAGQPFNLGSPKQLGEIFFDQMKLPVVKKTPGGAPSTDEEVLEKLAEDYPLPKVILEHRSLTKLKSTYTDKLPRMVNPKTGRVHTNYAQAVAVTGRLSSNDPNLQNIPVRTQEGRRIREAFIAPPGSKIVSADYSQIELRIMAHLSGDKSLLDAFANGEDIHRHTAAEVFSVPSKEVSSEQRRYAKTINFGLIYGMGAFGLASQLGIERAAAQSYIDKYFQRYPGVARYMAQTRAEAHEQGYVETVFGRRLWLADINSANQGRRAGAERQAINAPMQGTAADLIKLAMIAVQGWIESHKLKAKLIMQVHDELVLEVPEGEIKRVTGELPGLMTKVAKLDVPLEVEAGVGENWEKAH